MGGRGFEAFGGVGGSFEGFAGSWQVGSQCFVLVVLAGAASAENGLGEEEKTVHNFTHSVDPNHPLALRKIKKQQNFQ